MSSSTTSKTLAPDMPRFGVASRVTAMLALLLAAMALVGGVQVFFLHDLQQEVEELAGSDVTTMTAAARIDRETTLLISQIANLALASSRVEHRTSRMLLNDYITLFDEAVAEMPHTQKDAKLLRQLEEARSTFAATAETLGNLVGRRLQVRDDVDKGFEELVDSGMQTREGLLWSGEVLTRLALALRHKSPLALRNAAMELEQRLASGPEPVAAEPALASFVAGCRELLDLQRQVLELEVAISGAMKQGEREAGVLRSLTTNLAHRQNLRVDATAERSLQDLQHVVIAIFLAGVVMLGITVWVAYYITRAVSRRLNAMAGQLRGSEVNGVIVGGGDLHLPEDPHDELGALAAALNHYHQALRASEEKFRDLVESSSDWIWELNAANHYTYASPQVKSLLGYEPDEILGKTPFELMPEKEQGRVAALYQELQALKAPLLGMEQLCLHKDGREVALETNGVPILDASGLLLGYRGMDRDITARRQAEEALKESELRYRSLFEANSVVMLLVDPADGSIIAANKAACTFYGWSSESLQSMRIQDVNLLSPHEVNKEMQAALKGCKRYFEFRHKLADGSVRDVEVYSGPISVGGKDLLHSSIVDVTDRKQAEYELRKFRLLVENSPMAIVITNTQGTIEYVNPAFSVVTGYSLEEAVGNNPRMLKSGQHDAAFYEQMWQTIASGDIWRGEICNRTKSGDLVWEQVAIAPVKNEDGSVASYAAIKEDISYRKELERLKEDVDRIMRHDLKTPLTAILNLPRLLEMEGPLNQGQRDIVRVIENAGESMRRLIDLSLDMFKMETGTYEYTPKQVDVLDVLGKLLVEHRTTLESKELQVRVLLDGAPPEENQGFFIWAEERLLYAMLANLISNAMDASPEGGEILVELQVSGAFLISVRNSGAVPPAVRDRFFEKYATWGKSGGTGLGTYSAKVMAEVMGYEMAMETSDAENATRVSMLLPESVAP